MQSIFQEGLHIIQEVVSNMPVKKKKQQYYSLDKILKVQAEYNIILGERSNGKSYAIKKYAIEQAWKDPVNSRFVVMRRWDTEIKPKYMEQYFSDTPIDEITHHACDGICVYQGKIYLTKSHEDENKVEKVLHIGYVRALSLNQSYKSGAYGDVDKIIFEEFLSKTTYLPNEPVELMDFVSTVARRRKIQVFMIGNTITRLCPYFEMWELKNTVKQKQGTIELYNFKTLQEDEDGNNIVVKVAVELCAASGNNSRMFFGSSSNMIVNGEWQAGEVDHLEGKIRDYNVIYTVYFKAFDFRFCGELLIRKSDGTVLWYITPKTIGDMKPYDRIIVDKMPLYGPLTTIGLIPLSDSERQAFAYLHEGKVVFPPGKNIVGNDFLKCMELWK